MGGTALSLKIRIRCRSARGRTCCHLPGWVGLAAGRAAYRRGRVASGVRWTPARGAGRSGGRDRCPGGGRRAGSGCLARPTVLRLRHRGRAARRGRRRLACVRVDPQSALAVASPAAAVCEEVVAGWLLDLLGLYGGKRRRAGDRGPDGQHHLSGGRPPLCAPPLRVRSGPGWAVGVSAGCRGGRGRGAATIARSLRFLGIGSAQVRAVAVDRQGAILPGAVAAALAALPAGTPIIVLPRRAT